MQNLLVFFILALSVLFLACVPTKTSRIYAVRSHLDAKINIWTPKKLIACKNEAFKGVDTGGLGFVLNENELRSVPNESSKFVQPMLNGKDLLTNRDQKASRKIINFSGLSECQSKKHSFLYKVVQDRVKPYRDKVKRKANRENWWLYNEARPGLYSKIKDLDRVLVNCVVSKFICFIFVFMFNNLVKI